MKLRTLTTSCWRAKAHYHDHSMRRSTRLEPWPLFAVSHSADQDEHPGIEGDLCCGYSQEVTKVFEEAMRRCPSISVDADIMKGQPCIDGTRIPVGSVLRVIEHYGSIEAALRRYPHLNTQQVKDALYFSQIVLELPSGIDETALAS